MPTIIWRPVPGLPPGEAQDGTVRVGTNGHAVELALSVRPGRSIRRRRQVLTLSVEGHTHLFKPTMRDCKGGAEQIVRTIEAEIEKIWADEISRQA